MNLKASVEAKYCEEATKAVVKPTVFFSEELSDILKIEEETWRHQ